MVFTARYLETSKSCLVIIKDRVSDMFGTEDVYHYILSTPAMAQKLKHRLGGGAQRISEYGERCFSSDYLLEDAELEQRLGIKLAN